MNTRRLFENIKQLMHKLKNIYKELNKYAIKWYLNNYYRRKINGVNPANCLIKNLNGKVSMSYIKIQM